LLVFGGRIGCKATNRNQEFQQITFIFGEVIPHGEDMHSLRYATGSTFQDW
jgi:hypothetical protein